MCEAGVPGRNCGASRNPAIPEANGGGARPDGGKGPGHNSVRASRRNGQFAPLYGTFKHLETFSGRKSMTGQAESERYMNMAAGGSRRRAGNIIPADEIAGEKLSDNGVGVGMGGLS